MKSPQEAGFDLGTPERPSAFLQWKGTDACFDFYCKCGAHCYFDGYFAYMVECPHCKTVWEMPCILYPREADERTGTYWRENPELLMPDEELLKRGKEATR